MVWMRTLGFVLMMAVAACSMPSLTGTPERNEEAQALMVALSAGDDAAIMESLTEENDAQQAAAQLPFLRSLVPEGPVPEGKTQGWQANSGTGGTTYALVRTYDYPDRVITQEVIFRKVGETWKVQGFHLNTNFKSGASPSGVPAPEEADAEADSEEPLVLPSPGADTSAT